MILDDQGAATVEVSTLGNPPFPDSSQPGWEKRRFGIGASIQDRVEIPVGGTAERDALSFAINDQSRRDRLNSPG